MGFHGIVTAPSAQLADLPTLVSWIWVLYCLDSTCAFGLDVIIISHAEDRWASMRVIEETNQTVSLCVIINCMYLEKLLAHAPPLAALMNVEIQHTGGLHLNHSPHILHTKHRSISCWRTKMSLQCPVAHTLIRSQQHDT